MKIIKKIIRDKKKIFVFDDKKKISVLKIYLKGDTLNEFKNEIKGYKYFKKNRIYKIPKLTNFSRSNKICYIKLEFIDGKKVKFLNFNEVFKNNVKLTKKVSNNTYIDDILKFYQIKKNIELIKIAKNIKEYLKEKNFKNNLKLSFTHGDLAPFNCLKKDNDFYVFDFEKFKERFFLFDHINWLFQPIMFNLGHVLISKKFIFRNTFISKNILKYHKLFIYFMLKKILNHYKINRKEFTKFYLFYLFEKQSILLSDIKFVRNNQNKILTKKLIIMIKENINFIIDNAKF